MQVAMAGIAGAMAGFPALDPIAGGLVGLTLNLKLSILNPKP